MLERYKPLAHKIVHPIVKLIVRLGITPNMLTTIGLILNVLAIIPFVYGANEAAASSLVYVGWGGGLILFGGLWDLLDGQVARVSGQTSQFGALYDSVLDRYSEICMFFGILYYLMALQFHLTAIATFFALTGSLMVSYTRARAEGLGIDCSVGLMQRPERIALVGVGALSCGIAAFWLGDNFALTKIDWPFSLFQPIYLLIVPLWVVAILANITAIHRLVHSYHQATLIEKEK